MKASFSTLLSIAVCFLLENGPIIELSRHNAAAFVVYRYKHTTKERLQTFCVIYKKKTK